LRKMGSLRDIRKQEDKVSSTKTGFTPPLDSAGNKIPPWMGYPGPQGYPPGYVHNYGPTGPLRIHGSTGPTVIGSLPTPNSHTGSSGSSAGGVVPNSKKRRNVDMRKLEKVSRFKKFVHKIYEILYKLEVGPRKVK
jgi:hypothetical protein